MSNLTEFIDYLEEQVENMSIYVWGAQGQGYPILNESWIKSKESGTHEKNALKKYREAVAAGKQKVCRAFDCSGLGMYWLQNLKKLSKSDMTANGMKGKCTSLSRGQLKKGDWVFRVYKSGNNKGKAYHIGYIVDDALHVIESRGRAYGVQKRTLNASGSGYWNAYGRPGYFKSEIDKASAQTPELKTDRLLKLTSPYMRGDDVTALQIALNAAGCDCGSADGIFGKNTQSAVKEYQKIKGLKADGIAGEETITALGGIWDNGAVIVKRLLKRTDPLMEGDDVVWLKKELVSLGYLHAATKRTFGDDTEKAVKDFQRANNLTVDGIAGKNTVTALGGKWEG